MSKIIVDEARCKGCGLCVGICVKHIIHISDAINVNGDNYVVQTEKEECIGCKFCAMICPDAAISVYR